MKQLISQKLVLVGTLASKSGLEKRVYVGEVKMLKQEFMSVSKEKGPNQLDEQNLYTLDEFVIKPFVRVGIEPNIALIDRDADNEFIANTMAAAVAAEHGVDVALVHDALQSEIAEYRLPFDYVGDLKYEVYITGRELMLERLSAWDHKKESERGAGEVYSDTVLIHLFSTYDSIAILLKLNHLHESLSLCRVFLEQLALAYSLLDIDSAEDGFKMKPSKTVSNLNNVIPEAGRLYGLLCKSVHLEGEGHLTFLRDDGMIIVSHPKECFIASLLLMKLAEFWCRIYECTQKDAMKEFDWWKQEDGELVRVENEKFESEYDLIMDQIVGEAYMMTMCPPIAEYLDTPVNSLLQYLGYENEEPTDEDLAALGITKEWITSLVESCSDNVGL